MKTQNSQSFFRAEDRSKNGRPNGRRGKDKGLSIGIALLGAVCVLGVFGLLAVLFHAG